MKNLYVGNTGQSITADDLRSVFAVYGAVEAVTIIADKATGLPRGFGFVEMTSDKDAQEASVALNGSVLAGRTIVVSEARPKPKLSGAAGAH